MTGKPKWKPWGLAILAAAIPLGPLFLYVGAYYAMLSTFRTYVPPGGLYTKGHKPPGWLLVRDPEYSFAGHKLDWKTGEVIFGPMLRIDRKLRPELWNAVPVAPPPIPIPPPWRCPP
jgi:hypothetical protein